MSNPHWYFAPNPLTRYLPTFETIEEISEALRFKPLEGLDIRNLSIIQRHELLIAEKTPLHPSQQSLKTAMTIINMHRHSLRMRNPTVPQGRRLVNDALTRGLEDGDFIKQAPAPGACLLVIKGITGTSKSVTVKHTLRLLGEQVIRHSEEPAALWKVATQLSYLYVGMSHDGSRGGLLNAILLAIDGSLGTSFATDLPKKYRTLDRLAGAVISKLHSLYLGVLIIDEIQLLNLVHSEHAEKMHLFLLNLVNSGIPLVLIGNPLGFTWLPDYTQNLSRSLERPQAFFHPHGSVGEHDDDWDMVYQGIRAYYVLDEPPADEEGCSALLKRRSGGIPRIGLTLWSMAQLDVLLDGGTQVTPEDIEHVYRDDGFDDIRALCDGFANRDPLLLLQWSKTDIPVEYYARVWRKSIPKPDTEDAPSADAGSSAPADKDSPPSRPRKQKSAAAKLKSQETRERNKQADRDALRGTLPAEDMRMEGCKMHAMASLAELMKQIEGLPKPNAGE